MNYYSHHIGDYLTDTAHLSILEDGAYRRLMDRYYSTETPLTTDEQALFRLLRARSDDEKEAVRVVLEEFFVKTDAGWSHKRCDAEIAIFKEKSDKAADAANKRWNKPSNANALPDSTQNNAPVMPTQCERIPDALPTQCIPKNQEPMTNNHKPVKSRAETATASRLPADWVPNEIEIEFCKTERPDLQASAVADRFRDYWCAVAGQKGRKSDWPATWRNWVRNERVQPQASASPSKPVKFDPSAYVNSNFGRGGKTNERTIEFNEFGEPV